MDKNKFIVNQSDIYLQTQCKSFEERLNNIKISQDEEQEIIKNKTINTIRDKALGLFKVGEVISTILNWNDEIDSEFNEAKKAVLLEQYLNLADNHEEAINKLKMFLTNPQGNVLFNKILRILDDNPPDEDMINHLSSALKHIISNEDFYKLFEQHKFALSQIEKLSVQALTLLADYKNYPEFKIGASTCIGSKVSSEWNGQFVQAYCNRKGITTKEIITRVSHVVVQLQTQGYIDAYKSKENYFYCEVSNIGRDLLPYLTN